MGIGFREFRGLVNFAGLRGYEVVGKIEDYRKCRPANDLWIPAAAREQRRFSPRRDENSLNYGFVR